MIDALVLFVGRPAGFALPPQKKITQQQAGRAITSKSGGHSTKERHNLVVDLGNRAQETITDMQRAFVQVLTAACFV